MVSSKVVGYIISDFPMFSSYFITLPVFIIPVTADMSPIAPSRARAQGQYTVRGQLNNYEILGSGMGWKER